MFLHAEASRRLRGGAVALVVGISGCVGFASTASAAAPRHYEQASPADKGQGDVVGDGLTVIASKLGDAIAFNTRTPFGNEVGSGVDGQTTYVARRGDSSWTSQAATPTSRTDVVQTLFLMTRLDIFSDDLTRGIVWGYDLPGGGGTPNRGNIYAEDTATHALQALTVSQADTIGPINFIPSQATTWGMSADAQHVAFVSFVALLPAAQAGGAPYVYQWDAGRGLSLAGVLPDGTVPAGGSDVQPNNYRASMSADGSRLVFTATPNGGSDPQLYMRIDGSMTVPISEPSGGPDSVNVHIQAMTPDGRNVFFTTDSPLVPGDNNGGPDLYRWTDSGDAAHDGTFTQISTDGGFTLDDVRNGVIGVSDDGSRVYYETLGGQLVVWDNGTAHLISNDVNEEGDPTHSLAAVASQPGFGRVSPDGMWLAFMTNATQNVDGIHGLKGQVTNAHDEMYLYSLRDQTFNCISCPSAADATGASIFPDVTAGAPAFDDAAIRPRFLSDNGDVFFSTANALLPEDVNGVEDVYEYDGADGRLRLVSTGTGKAPAAFADAGASGDDVFIETRQQLVPGDRDNLVDLYDATTRSALPAAPTPAPACAGDTCQPPPSLSPPEDLLGSVSFGGSGNSSPAGKLLAIPASAAGRGAAVSFRVRLFAAGKVTWQGSGVLNGSARHGRGVLTVRVRLDRRARSQVNTKGRYITRVRLTFVLANGTRVSGIVRMTFRADAKKGR